MHWADSNKSCLNQPLGQQSARLMEPCYTHREVLGARCFPSLLEPPRNHCDQAHPYFLQTHDAQCTETCNNREMCAHTCTYTHMHSTSDTCKHRQTSFCCTHTHAKHHTSHTRTWDSHGPFHPRNAILSSASIETLFSLHPWLSLTTRGALQQGGGAVW